MEFKIFNNIIIYFNILVYSKLIEGETNKFFDYY